MSPTGFEPGKCTRVVGAGVDKKGRDDLFHLLERRDGVEEGPVLVRIANLAEKISILEGHANSARESVEASLKEIRSGGRRTKLVCPGSSHRRAWPNPDLAQLEVLLIAKRRQIKEIQDFRKRRWRSFRCSKSKIYSRYGARTVSILTGR